MTKTRKIPRKTGKCYTSQKYKRHFCLTAFFLFSVYFNGLPILGIVTISAILNVQLFVTVTQQRNMLILEQNIFSVFF
jgi:hypothetical protein